MRRMLTISLASSLLFLCGAELLYSQSITEGRILDGESGKPLEGAHVFFSGTKMGTSTDRDGHYRLRHIPPGGYRLVISIIGYQRINVDLVLGPGEEKTMDFRLKPVIYEMNEIYVGKQGRRWKKQLQRFERLFIGETRWADSVRILNPEVLRFDTNFWGRFTAKAMTPLQIENMALGYHITYFLDEFVHSGTRTRWDGEPLFTELASSDPRQQAYWERNRREAFNGSMRHFLLALLQNRVKEEGFILYNLRQGVRGYSQGTRYQIKPRRLIKEGDKDFLRRINFWGRLEIIYTREGEDLHYLHWARDPDRGPAGSQTSYLELNEHPITVDSDGEILEPYGATQLGYFAFQRLADLTPREYRPAPSYQIKYLHR